MPTPSSRPLGTGTRDTASTPGGGRRKLLVTGIHTARGLLFVWLSLPQRRQDRKAPQVSGRQDKSREWLHLGLGRVSPSSNLCERVD